MSAHRTRNVLWMMAAILAAGTILFAAGRLLV